MPRIIPWSTACQWWKRTIGAELLTSHQPMGYELPKESYHTVLLNMASMVWPRLSHLRPLALTSHVTQSVQVGSSHHWSVPKSSQMPRETTRHLSRQRQISWKKRHLLLRWLKSVISPSWLCSCVKIMPLKSQGLKLWLMVVGARNDYDWQERINLKLLKFEKIKNCKIS